MVMSIRMPPIGKTAWLDSWEMPNTLVVFGPFFIEPFLLIPAIVSSV
jgi:hypothetical protein